MERLVLASTCRRADKCTAVTIALRGSTSTKVCKVRVVINWLTLRTGAVSGS